MHISRNAIIIFTLLFASNALADPPHEQLTCKESSKQKSKVRLLIKNKTYYLETENKGCKVNFLHISIDDRSHIFLVGPDANGLGINAQNDIYLAPPGNAIATNIGSIPVRADFMGSNTFRDISQVGGSLFQTIYKIENQKLTITQPGYELAFADSQCIYKSKKEISCAKMTGTYVQPLCVWRDNERNILANKEDCAALQEYLDSQQGN